MSAPTKPCRLELNNSGAWKLLGTFDAAIADDADDILNGAAQLARAFHSAGGKPAFAMRVSTDEGHPQVLMRYDYERGEWREDRR